MYIKKLLIFLITISFLFINCSDSIEPIDEDFNITIPLKIGNQWDYHLTHYDTTNIVSYYENMTEIVQKDTLIENEKWYYLNTSPIGIWNKNKDDGFWLFAKKSVSNYLNNDTTFLVYRNPTCSGDKFNSFEVISTDTLIEVPSGKFKCIHLINKYESSDNQLLDSSEYFITPGIGLIKWMQIGRNSDNHKYIVYKSELISYSLK